MRGETVCMELTLTLKIVSKTYLVLWRSRDGDVPWLRLFLGNWQTFRIEETKLCPRIRVGDRVAGGVMKQLPT